MPTNTRKFCSATVIWSFHIWYHLAESKLFPHSVDCYLVLTCLNLSYPKDAHRPPRLLVELIIALITQAHSVSLNIQLGMHEDALPVKSCYS